MNLAEERSNVLKQGEKFVEPIEPIIDKEDVDNRGVQGKEIKDSSIIYEMIKELSTGMIIKEILAFFWEIKSTEYIDQKKAEKLANDNKQLSNDDTSKYYMKNINPNLKVTIIDNKLVFFMKTTGIDPSID